MEEFKVGDIIIVNDDGIPIKQSWEYKAVEEKTKFAIVEVEKHYVVIEVGNAMSPVNKSKITLISDEVVGD